MKARWPLLIASAPIMTLAWILFVYAPLLRDQKAIQRQTAEAEAKLTDFSNTTSQLPTILQTQQVLDSRVREFDSNLFAKRDILGLFDQIHQDAGNYSITIAEISPSVSELLALKRDMSSTTDPQFLNLTLRITGDYLSFGIYVQTLESAPYFRGVNSCQISSAPDRTSPTTFTIGIKALIGRPGESL